MIYVIHSVNIGSSKVGHLNRRIKADTGLLEKKKLAGVAKRESFVNLKMEQQKKSFVLRFHSVNFFDDDICAYWYIFLIKTNFPDISLTSDPCETQKREENNFKRKR